MWLWEWVAEEKAERSPKLKRFRKPEAVGRLMTEELGEERWESFKTSMNGRETRRSAGVRAKERKG